MDHSQFLVSDRLEHEREILRRVGKHSDGKTRKGVLVIGTQVLEQSLDLDFDLLITDLCPMDLLLQRIGRLHRHKRTRPTEAAGARCLVLNAQGELDGGSRAVYGDYLLLRTREILPETIRLPEDISPLVQKTYDEDLWTMPSDEVYDAAREAYSTEQKKKQGKAKNFLLPKPERDPLARFAEKTIVGIMNGGAPGFTGLQARAAVRDGTASIEVLVVQRTEDGMARLLSGEQKGMEIRTDTQPSREEARAIRDAAASPAGAVQPIVLRRFGDRRIGNGDGTLPAGMDACADAAGRSVFDSGVGRKSRAERGKTAVRSADRIDSGGRTWSKLNLIFWKNPGFG